MQWLGFVHERAGYWFAKQPGGYKMIAGPLGGGRKQLGGTNCDAQKSTQTKQECTKMHVQSPSPPLPCIMGVELPQNIESQTSGLIMGEQSQTWKKGMFGGNESILASQCEACEEEAVLRAS
jgi:hypothetical protein